VRSIVDTDFILPYYVDFSPDGQYLVVADWADDITVWDLTDMEMLYHIEPESAVQDIVFSPDGSTITAAGRNGKIYSWIVFEDKVTAKEAVDTIPVPDRPICFVTAKANAQLYVTPGDQNYRRLMQEGYEAEVDGKRFISDVTWWHLRDGTWVRSDFVTADTACEQVELVQ
jgi:WD40 repeat protein